MAIGPLYAEISFSFSPMALPLPVVVALTLSRRTFICGALGEAAFLSTLEKKSEPRCRHGGWQ